jgi:sialic acid synthase SpsE
LELIKSVSSKRKPIIISTGLGTYDEIALAIQTVEETWADVRECGGLMLMHCVASYPTSINNANIRNIRWLSDSFNLPVGYSDHTIGVDACPIAVAAGAIAIEKHFTYRRENQSFHDHHISVNPSEMRIMVERIREAECYLGNYQRTLTEDTSMLQHMRRSLGVSRDVEAGTKITNEMLTCLRPAWGYPPAELGVLVGRSLKNSLRAGSIVKDSDLN